MSHVVFCMYHNFFSLIFEMIVWLHTHTHANTVTLRYYTFPFSLAFHALCALVDTTHLCHDVHRECCPSLTTCQYAMLLQLHVRNINTISTALISGIFSTAHSICNQCTIITAQSVHPARTRNSIMPLLPCFPTRLCQLNSFPDSIHIGCSHALRSCSDIISLC